MPIGQNSIIKNSLVILGIFLVFSFPAFFFKKNARAQRVSLQYPKQSRQIASHRQAKAEVAQKACEVETRWLYKCDQNQKNCVKERRESFLSCKKL